MEDMEMLQLLSLSLSLICPSTKKAHVLVCSALPWHELFRGWTLLGKPAGAQLYLC